jgi:DNA mismatch endonuclease (patch repair protein)
MADIFCKEDRSFIMSRVRSKNTVPELIVRKFLFAKGYRYRVHVLGLPGKPDIVISKLNTIILVNGCFWHGHKYCRKSKLPRTRTRWWKEKIEQNQRNDIRNKSKLRRLGYSVYTIWECELKNNSKLEQLKKRLEKKK